MYHNNFVTVIKCDGKILREGKNGEVYLPFGTEYSILLKNKDARRAVVSLEVDGCDVLSNRKLVINGNESQEIVGFMKDMNKTNRFKFIKKTKEIQKHRGDRIDDGLVRVTYQFEANKSKPITWTNATTTYSPYVLYRSCDNISERFSENNICSTNTSSALYSCFNSAPKQDEGITVKGEKVDQKYVYTHTDDLDPEIYTIVLHLKGQSNQKVIKEVITVKTKFRCETCGRKNKSTNKFCYNCGTYLDKHHVA